MYERIITPLHEAHLPVSRGLLHPLRGSPLPEGAFREAAVLRMKGVFAGICYADDQWSPLRV